MGELPSGTLPGNLPALRDDWTERIFEVMENRYRVKWIDSFGGIPRKRVQQAWGEDMADFCADEIRRGLDACIAAHPTWPPTLPEFMLLCRPPVDAKADWTEAREQMAVRMRGEGNDHWSRPQVYWAAVVLGNYDLQTFGWEALRHRWERALAGAPSRPVPPWVAPAPALPKPGQQGVTREVARERSSLLARQVAERAAAGASNGWAVALLRREAAGEYVEMVAEGAWRAVLGFGPGVSARTALSELEARAA